MKPSTFLKLSVLSVASVFAQVCNNVLTKGVQNTCITFLIGPGITCDWMCNYCASQLNSSSYYFLPPVCSPSDYQSGGCIGNPQAGVSYSCCSN